VVGTATSTFGESASGILFTTFSTADLSVVLTATTARSFVGVYSWTTSVFFLDFALSFGAAFFAGVFLGIDGAAIGAGEAITGAGGTIDFAFFVEFFLAGVFLTLASISVAAGAGGAGTVVAPAALATASTALVAGLFLPDFLASVVAAVLGF